MYFNSCNKSLKKKKKKINEHKNDTRIALDNAKTILSDGSKGIVL